MSVSSDYRNPSNNIMNDFQTTNNDHTLDSDGGTMQSLLADDCASSHHDLPRWPLLAATLRAVSRPVGTMTITTWVCSQRIMCWTAGRGPCLGCMYAGVRRLATGQCPLAVSSLGTGVLLKAGLLVGRSELVIEPLDLQQRPLVHCPVGQPLPKHGLCG